VIERNHLSTDDEDERKKKSLGAKIPDRVDERE